MTIQPLTAQAQTPDARKAEADRLLQQGRDQANASQFVAALQSWQKALTIYREIKDRLGEAKTLTNMGFVYDSLGDYFKAIEYYQQSLKTAKEIKDPKLEGTIRNNLGSTYYSLGNYTKAIEYQQQGLAIARENVNRSGEGYALAGLGRTSHALGNYAEAIKYDQQSLAIAQQINDHKLEEKALNNLGIVYQEQGDYTKAVEYFQQSLALAKQLNNPEGEGISLGNLGNAYEFLGYYAEAIKYNQQSLAIAQQINDPLGKESALSNLGNTYQNLGDYAKAIEYQQQSLAIAQQIKDRRGKGQSLNNLGNAYHSLKDYTKAIEYFKQSLALASEIKDRQLEGTVLGNLGNAYYRLEDLAKAIDYYQQRLALAREIKYSQGEEESLNNLGIGYLASNDLAKAIEYFQQSLAFARSIKDRQGEGRSLNNLGSAFYAQGNLPLAETHLIEAIKVWESLRQNEVKDRGNKLKDSEKVSIFDTQRNTYSLLQKVLIAQKKNNPALEISERGRARAFVDLLASRLSSKPKAQSSNPPTIEEIKQIAKVQNATLVEYSVIFDGFKVKSKIQIKESEIYIWVIKHTGEVTFRKVDLKPLWQKDNTTLADLVISSRQSIGAGGRNAIDIKPTGKPIQKQNFQKLHQLLIEPVASLLPTNPDDRVIFIPHESLFLVPFAALQDKDGKYLIEKHTILTSPAIQVLELTRQQRQKVKGKDVLVMGNPTMPSVGIPPQKLPPLPSAEKEAVAIATLENTTALIGRNATLAAFKQKLPTARIIHLATHGLLEGENKGIPTAIALAPSGNDDGLLTPAEIVDLPINAELVVLSACDTGRGKITGDGVIGLSRSLITAGASSVIVSLWSVPDSPTSELMTEFYQKLQQNSDKAKALRSAMLNTMKRHPNPIDWAAFTLIGETQ